MFGASLLLAAGAARAGAPDRAAEATSGHVAAAKKAEAAGDTATALLEYQTAYAAAPTDVLLLHIGLLLEKRNDFADAYRAYEDGLTKFAPTMTSAQSGIFRARKEATAKLTAALDVATNEADAAIVIDGVPVSERGKATYRLLPGRHVVTVNKPGFLPSEVTVDVQAMTPARVELTLAAEARTGAVSIRENSSAPVNILVDGIPVGPSPWTGTLSFGPHEIAATSTTRRAAPRRVVVEKDKPLEIAIESDPILGRVIVESPTVGARIWIDSRRVATSRFAESLPVGAHEIRVEAEGFVPRVQTVEASESDVVFARLELAAAERLPHPAKPDEKKPGFYGGLSLAGSVEPSSLGDQGERRCGDIGASCSTSTPVGGAVLGYLGRSFGPAGLEIALGSQYDTATVRADRQSFDVARSGVLAAMRARLSWVFGNVRLSGAAGPGLSYRTLRVLSESSTSYSSLTATADASIGLRVARNVELMAGAACWVEDAGDRAVVNVEASRTPFFVASGMQTFVLPHVGAAFGF